MRQLAPVILGLGIALSAATPAQAATDSDAIIEALKTSPVYVAEGVEGVDSGTVSELTDKLRDGDNIVLVLLPSNESANPESVERITEQISDGLGEDYIVGVAVGDIYDAAAPGFPGNTADGLMDRADTVSQNTIDTMGTFVRNVHDWVRAHPEEVAPPPEVADGSFNWILFAVGAIGTAIVLGVIRRINRNRIRRHVHYTAPGRLNDAVTNLMNMAAQLPDGNDMRGAIDRLCRYTEAYFKRFTAEKRDSSTLETFRDHLARAQDVVKDYLYVQSYENRDFVDQPEQAMRKGYEAIDGLAESVRGSIKQGNRELLMSYSVNTNILSAQRLRNPKSRRR